MLDEPTNGVDIEGGDSIKDLLQQLTDEGVGILLTTHQLDVAQELSDRVSIIKDGEIAAEAPTRDLIERFSGNSFSLKFAGSLEPERIQRLISLGATVSAQDVVYAGSAEGLYDVINAIRPNALLSVNRDDANLAHVFRALTKGDAA